MGYELAMGTRIRRSPFFDKTIEAGVTAFSPYNHMYMPTSYGNPIEEYWRIINGVSMWDVSVERQVEVAGPDAAKMAQILSTRDLSKCRINQGKYVAICDHRGVIHNDPIVMKIDEDRYWFSIADSDMLLWARSIAYERGLNVEVNEPDVSPMAVQGPKAEDVVAGIFGDWVRDLKYFWMGDANIEGIPVKVARSGWSKQGGFEIYLLDSSKGGQLWDIVAEAGKPYDIGPGNPNTTERIESGLLSWGADTDDETNPFEIRMEKYVDLDLEDDVIGIPALRKIKADGIKRYQVGVLIDGPAFSRNDARLNMMMSGNYVGHVTSTVWSLRMERMIGICLASKQVNIGDNVQIDGPEGEISGEIVELPFL